MKLTMETTALVDLLAEVKDCSPQRTTIPMLSHVLMTADTGYLSVRASSLDIECSAKAAAEIDAPGATTVNGRTLHSIVAALPKGSICTLEHTGDRLTVKSGRARYQLQTLSPQDFPAMTPEEGAAFTVDAAEFKALMVATLPSVSTEATRFYMCGVFLHIFEGKLAAASTDGHRLCRRTMALPEGAESMPSVIIPTAAASLIAGLLSDGDATVRVSERQLIVATDAATIMTKLIDGTYPDYQRAIPRYNGASFIVDAEPFAAAVDRARRAALDEKQVVRVKLSGDADGLVVDANRGGVNAAHEVVDAEILDAKKFVGLNADYVATVAKTFGDVPLEFHIDDAESPVVVTSKDVPQQLMVVMPMRIGG